MTMPTTVTAVYENGVLRPAQPLSLAEGVTVEITVAPPQAVPPAAEAEVIRHMKAAKSLEDLFALANQLPPPADGYDLCHALNENRRLTGEPLLYPDADEGNAA
jgi:predicted DNA-binding antitoxin AbrB/MazE fold protein